MTSTDDRIAIALGASHHQGAGHRQPPRNPHGVDVVQLQRAYNEVLTRNKELTASALGMARGEGSKNKTRYAKKNMPQTDKNNVVMANNKIDTEMYSKLPIPPRKWYLWSENERSVAQEIITSGIALPTGVDPQEYWETVLVRAVNDKYSYTRSNLIQAIKKQYIADSNAKSLITVDAGGKIFMNIRNWDCERDGLPTYEDLEEFLRGIDKYIRHNLNGDVLNEWKRQNRNKTVIHKLKPGDFAHVTLIYEAMMGVWDRKVLGTEDQEPKAKPKYHKTGKIARFGNAWSDEGRQYFKTLVTEYGRLYTSVDFMTALVEHWRDYESKHHRKSYKKRKRSNETPDVNTTVNEADVLMDELPDFSFPELPALPPSDGEGSEATQVEGV